VADLAVCTRRTLGLFACHGRNPQLLREKLSNAGSDPASSIHFACTVDAENRRDSQSLASGEAAVRADR
jgi:hypothetical protein